MQLTKDEIVCLVDADLARALVEIPVFEVGNRAGRPGRHLLIQEARRPAAPVQRPAAHSVGKPFERYPRNPWHAPNLIPRRLRLGCIEVEGERGAWVGKAQNAGILDMLRQREPPRLYDKRAQTTADLPLPIP